MAHINDYLINNLDKPLYEKPFNEVDYSLLSQLSYLNLEGIVSSGCGKITFEQAYEEYKKQGRMGSQPQYDELFAKVANSARYKNLKLSHFKQVENPETLEQFGAYSIDLSKLHKVVFFRPTNGSLYSWKENFTVAYQPTSKTQEEAAKYFNELATLHPLQMFTLCGHSKGGNNAMYAGAKANKFNQAKIKEIINFDGPGFNSELNPGITNQKLIDRTTTYIPQGSVVGRLLDHKEKVVVVKTDNPVGLLEHDMNEWAVGEDGFLRAEKTNYKSDMVDKKFREILEKYGVEDRKKLIDGFFTILANTGYEQLGDILEDPKKLIRAYFKTDKEDRQIVKDVAFSVLRDKRFMKTVFGSKKSKDIDKYISSSAKGEKQRTRANSMEIDENEVLAQAC